MWGGIWLSLLIIEGGEGAHTVLYECTHVGGGGAGTNTTAPKERAYIGTACRACLDRSRVSAKCYATLCSTTHPVYYVCMCISRIIILPDDVALRLSCLLRAVLGVRVGCVCAVCWACEWGACLLCVVRARGVRACWTCVPCCAASVELCCTTVVGSNIFIAAA